MKIEICSRLIGKKSLFVSKIANWTTHEVPKYPNQILRLFILLGLT